MKKITRLECYYYFDNPKEIKRFLLTHDYLVEYFFEAYVQIKRIFKENLIEIRLEYNRYFEEGYEGLFVNIKTNLSSKPSLNLLEKFDKEWWLKVDFEIRSIITVYNNCNGKFNRSNNMNMINYVFVDKEKIIDFLFANSDLIPILLEAPKYIYEIFGQNVPIYLELYSDPEEEWDELFIVIKSPYSAKKAIELEKKLFDEWFVNIVNKVNNRLNFTEEPLHEI